MHQLTHNWIIFFSLTWGLAPMLLFINKLLGEPAMLTTSLAESFLLRLFQFPWWLRTKLHNSTKPLWTAWSKAASMELIQCSLFQRICQLPTTDLMVQALWVECILWPTQPHTLAKPISFTFGLPMPYPPLLLLELPALPCLQLTCTSVFATCLLASRLAVLFITKP